NQFGSPSGLQETLLRAPRQSTCAPRYGEVQGRHVGADAHASAWTPSDRFWAHLEALHGFAAVLSVIRIAVLGTRGVPARYSGFAACAEELWASCARLRRHRLLPCSPHHP